MAGEVLVLNQSWQPINIINWQDAICLWYTNKAEILEKYEDRFLHSYKQAFNMPAVIRLYSFIKPSKDLKFYKPFTRQNIYDHFRGRCAYCGKLVTKNKMTIDHVYPRSLGGLTNWQNIVLSCAKCNSKKTNKTLDKTDMVLLQKPSKPILADDYHGNALIKIKRATKFMNNQYWKDYLYWNLPLEHD
jgi:5-methylcytosine-specific restriction endonuclease McrA